MYEYEFVRLKCVNEKGFLEPLENQPEQDYRKIIDEYASNGWRLVQIFAPVNKRFRTELGLAFPSYYELIFERELE